MSEAHLFAAIVGTGFIGPVHVEALRRLARPVLGVAASSPERGRTLAARTPVASGVCYNTRFYPLNLEARRRIAGGQLGAVYHVTGSYHQDWLLHETDFNWRVLADEGGALRAVADIGTHWLDLVRFITGRVVVEVCADLKTVWPVRRRPRSSVETFSGKAGATATGDAIPVTTEDYGSVLLR